MTRIEHGRTQDTPSGPDATPEAGFQTQVTQVGSARSRPVTRPVLLSNVGGEKSVAEYRRLFATMAPDLDVRWWQDAEVKPDDVRYVFVWEPQPGWLARLPRLDLILSCAAGVDHITRDPACPRDVPIVRMGGEEAAQRMGEYISWAVLMLQRGLKPILDAQARREWQGVPHARTAPQTRVGIMGLGQLGSEAARMLSALRFDVSGWSRSRKAIEGVTCHAGDDERDDFLSKTDILVCLLPNTPATQGIINAQNLARLPQGAAVVNAGRASHVVEPDLLAALESGHLSGAVLDVFDPEPLPQDSPLWAHPKITVTPHLASTVSRTARAQYVADSIAAFERGDALANVFDPAKGY